jgi:hypothetical protein
MTFESEILSEIKPSEEECAQIIANAEELKKITESYLEDNGIDAKVIFAGSIGKDTYLRDPDIDMFIMFPEDMPSRTMEALGIEVGMAILTDRRALPNTPTYPECSKEWRWTWSLASRSVLPKRSSHPWTGPHTMQGTSSITRILPCAMRCAS